MNGSRFKNIISSNSGETLVEVMVAFVVLLIVLAMFSGSVASCSSAINHSIDIRRTTDSEYSDLHSYMIEKKLPDDRHSPDIWNRVRIAGSDSRTIQSDPAHPDASSVITFTAVKYSSGDTIYWVFE